MTREQTEFLRILKCFADGGKTELRDGDENIIANLSKAQQTDAIVSYTAGISPLASSVPFAAYCSIRQKEAVSEIGRAFGDAGIPYLIFKGSETAGYYPLPCLRQSGDIDILVDKSNFGAAAEILKGAGFEMSPPGEFEGIFTKRGTEVELHYALFYEGKHGEEKYASFGEKVWEYASTEDGILYRMDPSYHLVYLILHILKHLLWAGVTARQFLDIALMMKNEKGIDKGRVKTFLRETKAADFAATCFALTEKWFGVAGPVKSAVLTEEFFERATGTVLGFDAVNFLEKDGEEMADREDLYRMRKSGTAFSGKIGKTLSFIFPPYSVMKEKYPKMACPVLLPLMWARRLFSSLFSGSAREGARQAAKPLTLEKKEKKREEYFREWGIK